MVSAIGGSGSFDITAMQAQMQERMQQRFSVADVNGSDGLSLEEFQSMAPPGVDAAQAEEHFNVALSTSDSDGNGELSQSEFLSFLETQRDQVGSGGPPPPPPGGGGPGGAGGGSDVTSIIEELLAEDDEDETSATSSTDPADILEQILANAAEESETVFDLLDTDESGTISEKEYQAGVKQVQTEFFNALLSMQEQYAA